MMVNNDSDSHFMLLSTIFHITWILLIFFLVPFGGFGSHCWYILPSKSFPYPSAAEHSLCFIEVSHLVCSGHCHFFATLSIKHNTATFTNTPNLSVTSLTLYLLFVLFKGLMMD